MELFPWLLFYPGLDTGSFLLLQSYGRCYYCLEAVRYARLIEWSECLIKLMSALIEGINGMPVNMIRHIPFEFYVDEHIILMVHRFTALERGRARGGR